MKDASKSIHRNETINNNDYVRVQIPPEIAEHIKAEPGDTLAFQTEYSQKYGNPYASFWNESKEGTVEQKRSELKSQTHDAIFQKTPIPCRAENCNGKLHPYILHVDEHELKCRKCHREFLLSTEHILSEGDE